MSAAFVYSFWFLRRPSLAWELSAPAAASLGMRTLATLLAAASLSILTAAPVVDRSPGPRVQIALLLDTSNSMDGLIHQAKTQLWRIVNEFATVRKHGRQPHLQVALFEYGNNGIPAAVGYVRMVTPFTNDLDTLSARLFQLTTNGGEEYCGQVIHTALDQLSWDPSPDTLKIVYIAGNEPFTQGPVNFRHACQRATQRGIVVNTIHCGDRQSGVIGRWEEGALLGGGAFFSINSDLRTVIDTPYDAELARLNQSINATYVPYGPAGSAGQMNQTLQDRNAAAASPAVMAERASAKASGLYRNEQWDLVDAVKEGKKKVEEVREADLPSDMQRMTPAERRAHVDKMARQRSDAQARIAALQQQRATFIAQQAKVGGADKTLEDAVVASVRAQAAKAGFTVKP